MAHTFRLIIASVGETRFDSAVVSATLPGESGEFTVLAHHEPFVSTLKKGTIRVKEPHGDVQEFVIAGGVLECAHNRTTVLL